MRILAVDDDELILEILQSPLWLGSDHDLVCVTSAAAAKAAIGGGDLPFDAFLLDVVMPEQDGISLCAEIRAMPQHAMTPIIMITATQELNAMQRAFDAGATDFVRKPLDGLEMGARINMACMLNSSIRREREANAALSNMKRRTAIGYEHGNQTSEVTGAISFLALKNELLLLPQGCHALSLFSLRVSPFELPSLDLRDDDILHRLTLIGTSIAAALQQPLSRLAYAGRGVFVGMTPGRKREPLEGLQTNARRILTRDWQTAACVGAVPDLVARPVSTLGVWSGRSAVTALDDFVASNSDSRLSDPETLLGRLVGA